MAGDLNLLVVFDMLMRERSVTRAAARLHLTQPAVSHALARLRQRFNDPLLLRGPTGMEPTPLALEIAGRVRAALSDIDEVMSPRAAFQAAHSERVFTLGLSDYITFVLLPGLIQRIGATAPGVRLIVKNTTHATGIDMVERGEIEIAAGVFPTPPKRLIQTPLFEETYLCAARHGHPAFAQPLTGQSYGAVDHLNVSLRGEPAGLIDAVLAPQGIHRRIIVTLGHFMVAPFLLPGSDLVATEPSRIFAALALPLQLALQKPPVALPSFAVTLLRHRRGGSDPGLAWLAEQITATAVPLTASPGR